MVAAPTVGSPIRASFGSALAAEGVFSTYTPTLTAGTTNPTLGTGSERTGQYAQIGNLVICQAQIVFGTSGTNQGSGTYVFSLPVTPANGLASAQGINTHVGDGSIQCAGNQTRILVTIGPSGGVTLRYIDAAVGGSQHSIGSGTPGAWTAGDFIRINLMYQAA